MPTEVSVATDLGKLLRDSLNDEGEVVAQNEASRPVQLATAPMSFVPAAPGAPRASYPSTYPGGPASGIQPAGTYQTPRSSVVPLPMLPTPMSMLPSVPVAPPKSSAATIVAAFVACALVAGAAGGGVAWYRAKHRVAPHAKAAPTAAAPAPPTPQRAGAIP